MKPQFAHIHFELEAMLNTCSAKQQAVSHLSAARELSDVSNGPVQDAQFELVALLERFFW